MIGKTVLFCFILVENRLTSEYYKCKIEHGWENKKKEIVLAC